MKILVIGGSYFLGRVFTIEASKKHDLTLINRGTYPMKDFGVKEIQMDRNLIEKNSLLEHKILDQEFDAIVDFCAYQKGDIKKVLSAFKYNCKKYVFISTCEVYERAKGEIAENGELNYNTQNYPLEIKDYIDGKVALENELVEECSRNNVSFTSVRPCMIYGPFNYAPRESYYIQSIIQKHEAIFPKETDSKFQFVYVKDVVNAILHICKSNKMDIAYNICSPELLTYKRFSRILKEVADTKYNEVYLTDEELTASGIILPFPTKKQEVQIYNGDKAMEDFNFVYTFHDDGMKKTYNAFKYVYRK